MPASPANSLYTGTLQTLGLSRLKGRRWAHVTPRYVVDRLALQLDQRRHPDHPWLTRQMVAILGDWLRPGDRGHEWGSGRSTVWFARRVAELTSIEDHPAWGETIRNLLDHEGVADRVGYEVVEQIDQSSTDRYVAAIDRHANTSLDFCLVDGILRDRCALACLPKIKPGGILLIDNVNWFLPRKSPSHSPNSRGEAEGCASSIWHEVRTTIASWRCVWTSDGVTDTAFWVKPLA